VGAKLVITILRIVKALPYFVGLAYQGKVIVFRFIIEYSCLNGFCPLGNRSIFIWGFLKMIFWLVLKLEISYRVLISWRILVSFRGLFEDYIFAWWNIWVSIILLFIKIVFNVNDKATMWHTPCLNGGANG
jgi:hypothetical protein